MSHFLASTRSADLMAFCAQQFCVSLYEITVVVDHEKVSHEPYEVSPRAYPKPVLTIAPPPTPSPASGMNGKQPLGEDGGGDSYESALPARFTDGR